MNRQEIIDLVQKALAAELIGTKIGNKTITDVRVEINEIDNDCYCENSCGCIGGRTYNDFEVSVLTTTPKGRFKHWERYNI